MYKIAVDIGGTNIKLAVINNELNIIDYKTIATPDNIHILITNEIYLITRIEATLLICGS